VWVDVVRVVVQVGWTWTCGCEACGWTCGREEGVRVDVRVDVRVCGWTCGWGSGRRAKGGGAGGRGEREGGGADVPEGVGQAMQAA